MASIGDDAKAAGYAIVPATDQVKYGADEINKTRDMIALVKKLIPVGKGGYRSAAGISSGSASPTGGADGDVYFKII
jgi:hypothetical protein